MPASENGRTVPAMSSTPLRTISNLIVDQTLGNPSAILTGAAARRIVRSGRPDDPYGDISAALRATPPPFRMDLADAQRAYAERFGCGLGQPRQRCLPGGSRRGTGRCRCGRRRHWMAADDTLMTLLADSGIEMDGAKSTSPTSRRMKACRRRSTRGSPCSASSSITASISSPRAAAAPSSFR